MIDRFGAQLVVPGFVLVDLAQPVLGTVLGQPRRRIGAPSYFLSRVTLRLTQEPDMPHWCKRLFLTLANNAASPAEYFRLPETRTVVMGSQVEI
ncbi:KUP/HAK/KT family potassium transporter [Actinomadura alba]|uniref:K+ potassium transporter C-terminal domain-containing protein n=1 Tax=Actinomadura alba TaxID=406431 RepID=A0ABR7LS70_9ACTN|nr:hypothetical protein [Actinomadura alba]MBC6467278.1 hypothetical protein [Actinomadura alba]